MGIIMKKLLIFCGLLHFISHRGHRGRRANVTTSSFKLHTSYFVSRTEHAEGAERNHFLLHASHFLFHTCLPAEVTIGAVWANRVLQNHARQISAGEIDTGQIRSIEVDAG